MVPGDCVGPLQEAYPLADPSLPPRLHPQATAPLALDLTSYPSGVKPASLTSHPTVFCYLIPYPTAEMFAFLTLHPTVFDYPTMHPTVFHYLTSRPTAWMPAALSHGPVGRRRVKVRALPRRPVGQHIPSDGPYERAARDGGEEASAPAAAMASECSDSCRSRVCFSSSRAFHSTCMHACH